MNKWELVTAMTEKSGLSRKNCEDVLNAFTAIIRDVLKNGDTLRLVGFGTFEVKERSARTGRNIRTSKPVDIPVSKQPTFRPGKSLKEGVAAN